MATPAREIDDAMMPLGDHLEDLRRRVVLALLGLVPILVASLLVGRTVLDLLILPVQRAMVTSGLSASMQATGPLETFGAYLRVSLVLTLLVGSPWLLWQLWLFVRPGLYVNERRFVHVLVPMSAALTTAGVLFLYFVIMPVVLAFFIRFGGTVGVVASEPRVPPAGTVMARAPVLEADPVAPEVGDEWINLRLNQRRTCIGYEGERPIIAGTQLSIGFGIQQQYRVSEYVRLFLQLALAFSLGFQTPVVVLLLGWAGLVERSSLVKYRRHAAMGAAVLGAVLTPADPLSMILLGGSLYVLYELGGVLLVLMPAHRVAGGFRSGGEGPGAGDE